MDRTTVVTPAISLARELWRFGEDDLWQPALALKPGDMADIGKRTGQLLNSKEADLLWPNGPRGGKALLLAGIEHLEGSPRSPVRNRRRPEAKLPEVLQVSPDQRLLAGREVAKEVTRRLAESKV